MPARRGQGSPDPSPPSDNSQLKVPLSRAKAELDKRINTGRELAQTSIPTVDGGSRTGPIFFWSQAWGPAAKPTCPELDALRRKVDHWRIYNQTWLNRNIGGEAAQEYEAACKHWGSTMADDPATRLRFLREDIAKEISKLQSIRSRLPLWSPEDDTGSEGGQQSGTTRRDAAPASQTAQADFTEHATDFAANRKAVMVIYGHDKEANDALFDWLRTIGLEPREWTHLVQATGSGSPYVGQVLDRAFAQVQAVVALFTPDELVIARAGDSLDPNAWRLQARPNVLIEAGMALATHPARTVLATLGDLELPSDLAGRHYVRLSHTDAQALHDLASRLQAAGCHTDLTGAQWLNPSRFPDRKHASRSAQAEAVDRRAREATDARQVVVSIDKTDRGELGQQGITHLITVSGPNTYPIKQVEGQIAWQTNSGGFGMTGFGYGGDPPCARSGRICYAFRASVSPQILNPEPIVRFVDEHGNRYYQFRLHTQRFSGNTDWITAVNAIDLWLRTGPNPD